MITASLFLMACGNTKQNNGSGIDYENFPFHVDRFADIDVLRFPVIGFHQLPLQQRKLIYFLSHAAKEGRDILWDQHNRYNLTIRRICESIFTRYQGDRTTEEWKNFELYLKQIWFWNGIHHGISQEKIIPNFSEAFFISAARNVEIDLEGLPKEETLQHIIPIMFDPTVMARRMNQTSGDDLVVTSAINFYHGVTQQEVEAFYHALRDLNDPRPVSLGLNSQLISENGTIAERVWKLGGMYSAAIERIIEWLEKAAEVAENEAQRNIILTLIEFYQTGCLRTFDEFSVKWASDTSSRVDFINGFIEVYSDPLGMKGTWEGIVNFKSEEASERTRLIADNAQWFEDRSPIDDRFRKEEVVGISSRVVTVAMLGGDLYPTAAIGINLPNSHWIRRDYGSKSVTHDNIMLAHARAAENSGFDEEFMWSEIELNRSKKYGPMTHILLVDLHETIGHASGQLLPGVDPDALGVYGSPIEEARADLFALYFIADSKMVELGLLPNNEAFKAQYYRFIMNGAMTQLTRVALGRNIEQAHMRGRAMTANWVLAHGNGVVEMRERDGKTFVVINDYHQLRELFGQLLAEVQRITSEGDFEAAKELMETYGVRVNRTLHEEVLARNSRLNLPTFRGFINPVFSLVKDSDGTIVDVTVSYDEDFVSQQLRYSRDFSRLPLRN